MVNFKFQLGDFVQLKLNVARIKWENKHSDIFKKAAVYLIIGKKYFECSTSYKVSYLLGPSNPYDEYTEVLEEELIKDEDA